MQQKGSFSAFLCKQNEYACHLSQCSLFLYLLLISVFLKHFCTLYTFRLSNDMPDTLCLLKIEPDFFSYLRHSFYLCQNKAKNLF